MRNHTVGDRFLRSDITCYETCFLNFTIEIKQSNDAAWNGVIKALLRLQWAVYFRHSGHAHCHLCWCFRVRGYSYYTVLFHIAQEMPSEIPISENFLESCPNVRFFPMKMFDFTWPTWQKVLWSMKWGMFQI